MKGFTNYLLVTLLGYTPVVAVASDVSEMTLEELLQVEIVSSASKMRQKVSETPTAIRVITSQDIRRYGWRTLGEALNALPGIFVVTNRYYDFIGARGVVLPDDYNTRYLMVIDGTPVNDALLESAFVGDAFPLDIALVERIEYVPGAGSAAYGANAMLGTINITTKSAIGKDLVEAEAGFDTIGRKSLRLTMAHTLENDAGLMISAAGLNQSGNDQTYEGAIGQKREANGAATPDGVAHDLDKTIKQQLYAKLEKSGLRLSLMLSERKNNPSTAPHGANFDDSSMKVRDRSFDLTANYSGEIRDDLMIYGNLSYMGYRNTIYTPRYKSSPPKKAYLQIQDADAERVFAELRLTMTGWKDRQTAIGVDLSKETRNALKNSNSLGITDYQDNRPDTRIGLYLQDQWKFGEEWQLHTGVRQDHSEMWGDHFSPRLGLTWQATKTLSVKAIGARAFRNPNPLEARAGIDPQRATAAPFEKLKNLSLEPESVDTREIVLEWRPNPIFEMSGSLFQHHLRKLIGVTTTSARDQQSQNLYGLDIRGFEGAASYRFQEQWKINASVTLLDAERHEGGLAPNAADWLIKLGMDGLLWRNSLHAAWELYAVGPSKQTWEGRTVENRTLVQSNLALTAKHWVPGVEVQLRINNLFDRDDVVPGSDDTPVGQMPIYGRHAWIGLRYAF